MSGLPPPPSAYTNAFNWARGYGCPPQNCGANWFWIIVVLVILGIIAWWLWQKYGKKQKEEGLPTIQSQQGLPTVQTSPRSTAVPQQTFATQPRFAQQRFAQQGLPTSYYGSSAVPQQAFMPQSPMRQM